MFDYLRILTLSIMKNLFFFVFVGIFSLLSFEANAQDIDTSKTYVVIKNDGTEYVGQILSKDGREVLIKTKKVGDIYIPMHEIKEIKEVDPKDLTPSGAYQHSDAFATRYFITTNGVPIEKGESYILWNLYGPDFEFGVADNLTVGIMTTWLTVPLVGSVKYTIPLSEGGNTNLAVGTLLGTGSWAGLDNFGALPYASLTMGDRKANISLTGGFIHLRGNIDEGLETETRPLLSIGGLTKIGNKASFVFDSVIAPPTDAEGSTVALLMPGIRIQTKPNKAFQFGFTAVAADGEVFPFPLPFIQWFQKI